jgi:hypothetical protein
MCAAVGHRRRAGARLGRRLQLQVHRHVDGSADTAIANYAARPTGSADSCNSRVFLSLWHLISGSKVKKGPENRISVVDGKPEGVRERPMTDPSVSITRCPPGGRPSPWTAPSWAGGHRAVSARGFGWALQSGPAPGRADLTGRAESRVDAYGPGREASPPRRPATGPAASTPGNGGAGSAVTARDPAPGPAGLPLRQCRAGRALPVRSRGTSRLRDRLSGLAWLLISPGGQPLVSVPSGGPDVGGGRT